MKCGELIKYLSRFGPEEQVAALVVDLKSRLYYKIGAYQFIDETAALLLEVAGSGPLDDLVEEADERKCRVCGCTWDHVCEGGCYWVEEDLCSKCAEATLAFRTNERASDRMLEAMDDAFGRPYR